MGRQTPTSIIEITITRKESRKYEDIYRKGTKKSLKVPRNIDKAEDCRFIDIDGHEYIDFHNYYTTMILGHASGRCLAEAPRG